MAKQRRKFSPAFLYISGSSRRSYRRGYLTFASFPNGFHPLFTIATAIFEEAIELSIHRNERKDDGNFINEN